MDFEEGKIKRAFFLSKKIKNIMDNKNITIQNIADNLGFSHAYISQNLSGKKIPTDDLTIKILKAIGLNSIEIKNIIKQADKEEFIYKHGEDIDLIPQTELEIIPDKEKIKLELIDELGDDFIKELSLSRKFRNNETLIDEAKEIWTFMKEEAKKTKKQKK